MLNLLPLGCLAAGPTLQIDPLLIVEAGEVWSVIGDRRHPLWPGWDPRRTPVLIYFPDRQDVLINHPKPPAGFELYKGLPQSSIGPIYVRNGKTFIDSDGQNTTWPVAGVQTLVVADSLSTRRQWAESLGPSIAANPDDTKKIATGGLFPNPYTQITMFAHEAFHVFQKTAAKRNLSEEALMSYPSLSVENNVGFALEAEALAEASKAKTAAEAREVALRWLAIRLDRRKSLTPAEIACEDAIEFSEGLAKYIEYRTLERLEPRKPAKEMWLVQGFRGYEGLDKERKGLIDAMRGFMNGSIGVNNDPYGASPVRFRMYYSGMGIGALLDRLGVSWQTEIFRRDVSLTELVRGAAKPSDGEIARALEQVRQSPDFATVDAAKRKLAADGQKHIDEVLAGFDRAPAELTLDYSALKSEPAFSYTSFGILRIDADRNVFRLVPIRGQFGSTSFAEASARPVLYDRKSRTIRLQLTERPDLRPGELNGMDLNLPGLSLKNVKGTLSGEGRKWLVQLHP